MSAMKDPIAEWYEAKRRAKSEAWRDHVEPAIAAFRANPTPENRARLERAKAKAEDAGYVGD